MEDKLNMQCYNSFSVAISLCSHPTHHHQRQSICYALVANRHERGYLSAMTLLLDYLSLFRPRYHLPFFTVVITSLVFGTLPFALTVLRLLGLYVSFCLCLYGALYTINGIVDRALDAAHPRKCNRPFAAGRIRPRDGWIFAAALLALAFGSGWFWFGPGVVALYVAFMAINVLYTFVLKTLPYLEIVANAATHPLRMVLGLTVAAGVVPWPLVTGFFCLAIGASTMRRVIEKQNGEEDGRPVLRRYTFGQLRTVNVVVSLALLGHLLIAWPHDAGWLALFFGLHFLVAFVGPRTRAAQWLLG